MWENYGAVNLELAIEGIDDANNPLLVVSAYRVSYEKDEHIKMIQAFLKKCVEHYNDKNKKAIQRIVQIQMNKWKMLFKGSEYQNEQELRVVLCVEKSEAERLESGKRPHFELYIAKERCAGITACLKSKKEQLPCASEICTEIKKNMMKESHNYEGFSLRIFPSCDNLVIENKEWRGIYENNK